MKFTINLIWIFLAPLFFFISCSKGNSSPKPYPPSGIDVANLLKLEEALNLTNADFVNLINKIRGSVATNGPGSKVIWSKKNDYKLGLFVSANHVYGIHTWPSLNEEYIDITATNNGIFLGSKIPQTNGNIHLTNELIANFGLYHPLIQSGSTNTTILPKDDFYLGIIDNQKITDNGLGNYPNFVKTTTPLQMYDPNNRTQADKTWSVVETNQTVIVFGYPQDKASYPNGAVATGRVYSNLEAENTIRSLKLKGDSEGEIPYNPEIEFLANVEAIAGMSGGGVFNNDGQLLGIMVRATKLNGEPILRVVRINYIKQKMNTFYNTLSISNKNKMRPFISGELD